ncbi:MAG: hypothetical protein K9L66_10245 [Spirochaetaceae bacterium]|nr:hypothetical protein [Spirochaetaceae bacterium]MCF7949072.1 hypothetical protein [Spirochaetia bacterium]MCF7951891.1 hypothetical protein [Spirochaetaceae bacterium]
MKQFIVKLIDMFLLLLLAVVCAWTFLSCSKSEEPLPETGTARTEEQKNSTKRVDKPERTLIFGEEEERAGESGPAETDSEVRVAEPSAVLQRNAAFLERSGSKARYPFDLIIGKIASYQSSYSETEGKADNGKVAALGERFLRAAFDGKMNIVKQLSSPAAQDSLSVQVKAWETQDVQIEEIRIGAIHLDDATAHFDFRVIAQIGRGAGNAVAVFAQDRWTVQAIEFDAGRLQDEYVPPEYTDFPDNYGYFQY